MAATAHKIAVPRKHNRVYVFRPPAQVVRGVKSAELIEVAHCHFSPLVEASGWGRCLVDPCDNGAAQAVDQVDLEEA